MKYLSVLLLLVVSASAQIAPNTTGVSYSGRFWATMSQGEKLTWLIGYFEGITDAAVELTYHLSVMLPILRFFREPVING